MKYNVMLSVNYDIEAESKEEAISVAKTEFSQEAKERAKPVDVITTIDAVEGSGVTGD